MTSPVVAVIARRAPVARPRSRRDAARPRRHGDRDRPGEGRGRSSGSASIIGSGSTSVRRSSPRCSTGRRRATRRTTGPERRAARRPSRGAAGWLRCGVAPGAPGRTTVASAARRRGSPAAEATCAARRRRRVVGVASPSCWAWTRRRRSPRRRALPATDGPSRSTSCLQPGPVGLRGAGRARPRRALARGARARVDRRCSTRRVSVRTSSWWIWPRRSKRTKSSRSIGRRTGATDDRAPRCAQRTTCCSSRWRSDRSAAGDRRPSDARRSPTRSRPERPGGGQPGTATPRRLQDCSTQVAEWTGQPPLAFLPTEPAFDRVVWEGRPLHDARTALTVAARAARVWSERSPR